MHLYTLLFRDGWNNKLIALSTWARNVRQAETRGRFSLYPKNEPLVLISVERQ